MKFNIDEIVSLASKFEKLASSDKKLDPKAKIRHRGTVAIDVNHPKNKSDKQHFPINDADQARNALARVNAFSKAPEWWSGSLQDLVNTVVRKVHSKFPSIEISEKAKKPGKG